MSWLDEIDQHHSKKYSQAGQDGLIEYIFSAIGTTNKFCIECGFNSTELTGGSGSNTARLILEDGWTGLLFDSEHENREIGLYRQHLTRQNIGLAFEIHHVPREPDYVSIDVDGDDLWLMRGVLEASYRPWMISVEYNALFPITVAATMMEGSPGWENDAAYGASLLALNRVAMEFDYRLIAVEDGLDAFFIRQEVVGGRTSLLDFEKFTNHYVHPYPTKERAALMVEYPSLEPLSIPLSAYPRQ